MSDRIAILIPTRGRPELFFKAVQSIFDTSRSVDVYAYIDSDERELYEAAKPKVVGAGAFRIAYGDRCGPVGASQALMRAAVRDYGPYRAMGLFVDDCTFTVPGWDEAVFYEAERLGKEVWAMSPAHSQGTHMDFAIVSDRWVEQLGWIAYPALYHFGWPSIVEALGEATSLVRLAPEVMFVEHDRQEPKDIDKSREDLRQLHAFFTTNRFHRALELLRSKRSTVEEVLA